MLATFDGYYLLTKNYNRSKSGSIFYIHDKIGVDFENGTTTQVDGTPSNMYVKIPENITLDIKKINKAERCSAFSVISNTNNVYYSKSTARFLYQNANSVCKYYLIPRKYFAWDQGTIFQVANDTIYDCDFKNGAKLIDGLPTHWIEISNKMKHTLSAIKRTKRLEYYILNKQNTDNNRVSDILTKNEPNGKAVSLPPNSVNVPPKNQYFEYVVICPSFVVDVQALAFNEWTVGDSVRFTLLESGGRYTGTLKWTGTINSVSAAAVHLVCFGCVLTIAMYSKDPGLLNGLLVPYQCSKPMLAKLHLSGSGKVVLIRLSVLYKYVDNYDVMSKYFSQMFGCLGDSVLASDIFIECLKVKDQNFVTSLINHCPPSFVFDLCTKLISSSIKKELQLSYLKELIDKMPDTENVNLLKLAKVTLTLDKDVLFNAILAKCIDRNVHLDDGETFLTHLIKDNVTEERICRAIKTKQFDINKPNKVNETPLTLAPGRSMVALVGLLVSLNCNIDHDKCKAIEMAFVAKKTASNMDELKKIIEIIEILTKATKPEVNICTICMDEKVNTVYDCGHNSCKNCADQLLVCHFCKKTITIRSPLYLA